MGRSGSYRLHHSKNFLRQTKLVDRLVRHAGIDAGDIIVEIGAGDGKMTSALARHAGQVIAIEQDARLVDRLSNRFRENRRVCVFGANALEFPLPSTPFKVFANIPFRHTSEIVGKLTTGVAPPDDMWLVVQKEAADRYVPGDKMTMVALTLAPWFEASIEHRFQRRDFQPAPRVDSVLLRLLRRDIPLIEPGHRERFTHLVEAMFSAWQPTIEKALNARLPRRAAKAVTGLPGLDVARRPSQVELETWIDMYQALDERNDDRVWEELRKASEELRQQQAALDRPTRTPARRRRTGSG